MNDISVLVVEDEPLIADAHGQYVGRVPGFVLAGIAHNGQEALRIVREGSVDLILLDFNLPDVHGLELCRTLRTAGIDIDVIAVTSTRDLAAVRAAVSRGVIQYLLKPFTFRSLKEKLEHYKEYRRSVTREVTQGTSQANQSEIDRAFVTLRGISSGTLPTGLSDHTLEVVVAELQLGTALSASEVALRCDISRVTARRYLEHLTSAGAIRRGQRHGGGGRPEIEYTWPNASP